MHDPPHHFSFWQDLANLLDSAGVDAASLLNFSPSASPDLSNGSERLWDNAHPCPGSLGFTDALNPLTGGFTEPTLSSGLPHPSPLVFQSAHSTCSNHPSIGIDQSGFVTRYDADGSSHWVGKVSGNTYYNTDGVCLGYLKDGIYYDYLYDKSHGSVHGGHIFNHRGGEIARADTNVEGGAWIAFIERGGIQ
jgi:hypothetical protein